MRRLILLRHAKAERPDGIADLDRALNPRGREAAARIGAYLAAEGLRPDHVLVSPSTRTMQTWEGIRPNFEGLDAETVPSLYEALPPRILDAIRAAPGEARSLLVIGHNPSLHDLALQLADDGPRKMRADLRAKFPTAALAVIDFDVEAWAGIGEAGGHLDRFVTPSGLADAEG